ncbi:hypothetical protein ACVW0Y_001018 [Pseudomonas sp. TE3786]
MPEAHEKVAEQLAARRPELFENLLVPYEVEDIKTLPSDSDAPVVNNATAANNPASDVPAAGNATAARDKSLNIESLLPHTVLEYLPHTVLEYLSLKQVAQQYAELPPERRTVKGRKIFAEDHGYSEEELDRYVSPYGVLTERPMAEPIEAGSTRHILLRAILGGRLVVQPGATPKPPADTLAKPVEADAFIDTNAPPVLRLDTDNDEHLAQAESPPAVSFRAPSPDVIELPGGQAGLFRPWIKPEPVSPPEPVREPSPEPIAADAPVKVEPPIVRHRIDNRVPILQGPNGEDILLSALQPPQKNRQTNNLADLLDQKKAIFGAVTKQAIDLEAAKVGAGKSQEKRRIKDEIAEKARWLAKISGEERAQYMENWMETEEVPGMGWGVKAARDIPVFTVLAPYAGKLLKGEAVADEWDKVGGLRFTEYSFGTTRKDELISAFGDGVGNISSLINKGDTPEQNNLTIMRLGGKLNYFMSESPIKAGAPLLYDYGRDYDYSGWSRYPIWVQDSESSDDSATESGRE